MIQAIGDARKSIDVAIFRFDHKLIEKALVEAIRRSVTVRALIAFTNRGGESRLRGLESRLLAAGAAVARTADDLGATFGQSGSRWPQASKKGDFEQYRQSAFITKVTRKYVNFAAPAWPRMLGVIPTQGRSGQ